MGPVCGLTIQIFTQGKRTEVDERGGERINREVCNCFSYTCLAYSRETGLWSGAKNVKEKGAF